MICHSMKIARDLLLLLVVAVGGGFPSLAATSPSGPFEAASQTVKGEVVMIAGDLQEVEDPAGKKEVHMIVDELYVDQGVKGQAVSLHVNDATQLKDTIEVGDKVEAQVAGDGYALSIQKTE